MIDLHEFDTQFLAKSLTLAEKGKYTSQPNPRVGCVIVKDGQIIGEGWHIKAGEEHAEVNAILDAKNKQQPTSGATAYVSLEPCSFTGKTPPCVEALIDAQITRVVCASLDPNPKVAGKGINMLINCGVEASITKDSAIQSQAEWLNRGFFKRMRSNQPWVMLKSASSIDGKIADNTGESKWITSIAARTDVHKLRAESCAIVTGSGTQVADDPTMNARLAMSHSDGLMLAPKLSIPESILIEQPLRVLLDSDLKLTEHANIIGSDNKLHIFTTQSVKPHWLDSSTFHTVENIDLEHVLDELSKLEVNNVMIEAGSTLAGAFIEANLVDEIVHYVAPSIIGTHGRDMFEFSKALPLKDKKQFSVKAVEKVGDDIKITYIKE